MGFRVGTLILFGNLWFLASCESNLKQSKSDSSESDPDAQDLGGDEDLADADDKDADKKAEQEAGCPRVTMDLSDLETTQLLFQFMFSQESQPHACQDLYLECTVALDENPTVCNPALLAEEHIVDCKEGAVSLTPEKVEDSCPKAVVVRSLDDSIDRRFALPKKKVTLKVGEPKGGMYHCAEWEDFERPDEDEWNDLCADVKDVCEGSFKTVSEGCGDGGCTEVLYWACR